MPEAVQVFIAPPSRETLRARLVGRGTDTPEQVKRRLETADAELAAQPEFEHVSSTTGSRTRWTRWLESSGASSPRPPASEAQRSLPGEGNG